MVVCNDGGSDADGTGDCAGCADGDDDNDNGGDDDDKFIGGGVDNEDNIMALMTIKTMTAMIKTTTTMLRLIVITKRLDIPRTEYLEALPSSANDEVRCDCTFADDGNSS